MSAEGGFSGVGPGRLARVTEVGSGTWLAWTAWAALALGVVALVFTNAQIKRNRKLAAEQTRPHAAMLMEPHAAHPPAR